MTVYNCLQVAQREITEGANTWKTVIDCFPLKQACFPRTGRSHLHCAFAFNYLFSCFPVLERRERTAWNSRGAWYCFYGQDLTVNMLFQTNFPNKLTDEQLHPRFLCSTGVAPGKQSNLWCVLVLVLEGGRHPSRAGYCGCCPRVLCIGSLTVLVSNFLTKIPYFLKSHICLKPTLVFTQVVQQMKRWKYSDFAMKQCASFEGVRPLTLKMYLRMKMLRITLRF